MLYYNRTDVSEGTDPAKSNNSKNALFTTIDFLIIGLNIKVLFLMVVMIC